MSYSYRIVTVKIMELRVQSIMVEVPKMQGWQSIPRSLIYGPDDLKLTRIQHDLPQEVTLRIVEWIADQLHLA